MCVFLHLIKRNLVPDPLDERLYILGVIKNNGSFHHVRKGISREKEDVNSFSFVSCYNKGENATVVASFIQILLEVQCKISENEAV